MSEPFRRDQTAIGSGNDVRLHATLPQPERVKVGVMHSSSTALMLIKDAIVQKPTNLRVHKMTLIRAFLSD